MLGMFHSPGGYQFKIIPLSDGKFKTINTITFPDHLQYIGRMMGETGCMIKIITNVGKKSLGMFRGIGFGTHRLRGLERF
jgi:hypothetical protein